ncbi:AbiV family abortive infection protein [Sulfurovum sp.]|uniref:AbiV family abortive infection protein n=1 Tax=Sulfurovum sp. TaxID=1969726 RepID=UPI00356B4D1D
MKKRDFFEEFATRLNIEESLVRSTKELNAVIQHIVQLLTDSYILYSNNSFPSSVFLSITALEEVSKGHWGIFMSGVQPKSKPRKLLLQDHQLYPCQYNKWHLTMYYLGNKKVHCIRTPHPSGVKSESDTAQYRTPPPTLTS